MKNLVNITRFIWSHPLASRNRLLAYGRFLSWQIRQNLRPRPEQLTFVEDSVLVVEKGMAGATGNIYTGLMEFEEMAFVLHILRAGDLFLDVGANVGAYTILAAKNAGARVISIEPIPDTFNRLKRNVEANKVTEQVDLKRYGVGDKAGMLSFTGGLDSMNHVLDGREEASHLGVVEVPVKSLDELLEAHEPVVCKMDVEGFEWPALQGATRLLSSTALKALIIELNGSGARYGFDDGTIRELLHSYGFESYSYEPFGRQLKRIDSYRNINTIYIRDADWIKQRLAEAKKYRVLNIEV